ncbi:hypothetical protein PGTUg99_014649 [Puccinia graminis f. sp. tritici]|uniref:Uncharacterized protein n=1 Tax=Puccinia graminis f. sp. tritici TaxID=56615 RepID=A0A5B0M4A2_PUCGR|nr:hypothetical protein PGTUg99_014649 [Puccinia graminis f. sp. tritici]
MPRRLEGNLSSRRGCASPVGRTSPAGRKPSQPAIGSGYPLGYPDIRQVWGGKRPSAAESAPPGGYPLGPAGIRQRITDIRSGLSATISNKTPSPRCQQGGVLSELYLGPARWMNGFLILPFTHLCWTQLAAT